MKKLSLFFGFTLIIVLGQLRTSAQTSQPYTDGPVWEVQFVKAKPGMNMLYLKNLSEGWIKVMREAKIEGVIMDFKVLSGTPASKDDWNLMLMYELKNYAAQDNLEDKFEAIRAKLLGGEDDQHKAAIARNDLRELLGGKTVQELIFK